MYQPEPLIQDLAVGLVGLEGVKLANFATRGIRTVQNVGQGTAGIADSAASGQIGRHVAGLDSRIGASQARAAPWQTQVGANLERSDGLAGSAYRFAHRLFGSKNIGQYEPKVLRQLDDEFHNAAHASDTLRQRYGTNAADDILTDSDEAVRQMHRKLPENQGQAGGGAPGAGGAGGAGGGAPGSGGLGLGWKSLAAAGVAVPALGYGAYRAGQSQGNERADRERWLGAGAGFAAGVAAPNVLRNAQSYLSRMNGAAPAANPAPYGGYGV
jgi:hypothetical protein